MQTAATEANSKITVGIVTSPARRTIPKSLASSLLYIALIYSHKTNVGIEPLLAFVMIYNTVIDLIIMRLRLVVCNRRLPLVLRDFG